MEFGQRNVEFLEVSGHGFSILLKRTHSLRSAIKVYLCYTGNEMSDGSCGGTEAARAPVLPGDPGGHRLRSNTAGSGEALSERRAPPGLPSRVA